MSKRIVTILGMTVGLFALVVWANPAQAQINDHYACYQVKHKLTKGQTGTVLNQVEAGSFQKCKLKFLCVPTDKSGSGPPPSPNAHYLCHQCKGSKIAVPYTVTDQFVAGAVTTKKFKLICNIATKS